MKTRVMICCALLLLILSGCSLNQKAEIIDLSGTFYTVSGDTAKIKSLDENKWEITYSTSDGEVTASFETKWESSSKSKQSKMPMQKSDDYSGFDVVVDYVSLSDIKITIVDGNGTNEMVFTKEKPKDDGEYGVVLQGNLSPFAGQFSSDQFNKTIAESGFTYGGYYPEDYYNNVTTVFPAITEHGYWDGITSHGNYEVKTSDMPKKLDGYYEVNVYPTNESVSNGEITFFLVPPKVKGPDGTLSDEKRVFQKYADGRLQLLEYQKQDWWKAYQSQDKDLDIEAINNGDFSTLVGTWENGEGYTLIINSDGTTSDGGKISAVKDSDKMSKVPYARLSNGETGVPIGLFKIGFKNPDGDQSDTTRPRLVLTSNAGAYPADSYYYRK